MSSELPLIGAAMPVEQLPTYRDWLLDGHRDLELQSFTKAEVLDGDWKPLVDTAKAALDGYQGRLGIHGPFWGLPLASKDAAVRQVVTHRFLQGLEVCEALGATLMVVHSPFTAWTHHNAPAIPGFMDSLMDCAAQTLEPAVQRAEAQGTVIAIENIEDMDPANRVHLVQEIGSDAVRVSLDTGHAGCAVGMSGAPPVDYFVRAAGNLLAHVHLQDVDGYADRHWTIGDGTIPWPAVFKALGELESAPRMILEMRDYANIPKSMAFLQRAGLGR